MPFAFGCVNARRGADESLREALPLAQGEPLWTRFQEGWFAAAAHGGRRATWLDDDQNAWAVFGERLLSERRDPDARAPFALEADGGLALAPIARGLVALFDARQRRLTLQCDVLNYFPVYVHHRNGALWFGTHLRTLARATGALPDYAGMTQFLRGNWCLNGRTLFAGVTKLLPGQRISYDLGSDRLVLEETSRMWAGEVGDSRAPSDEEVWACLLAAVRTNCYPNAVAGLMLSGGWDSRVMLAALAHVFGKDLLTVSHGAVGHGELALSRRLAARMSVPHQEIALEEDILGRPADHDQLLDATDSLIFPWWRFGRHVLSGAGATVGFSGLLGEVLGGHYTVVGRGRSRRAREVFARSVLRTSKQDATPEAGLRRVMSQDFRERRIPFLKDELTSALQGQVVAALEADMAAVVDRYQRRGITNAGRIVEAYNTEYRALDYFCQQPVSLMASMDVGMPLGDPAFVEAVLAVPLPRRIHNSLSRSVLKRFQPALLEVPLAASPYVPASAPILVQEGGRIVRWVVDRASKQAYLLSGGRMGVMRRYGWMDFEGDVRRGDYLDAWRESLTWDGFDRDAIDRYVDGVRSHQTAVRLGKPVVKLAYIQRLYSTTT